MPGIIFGRNLSVYRFIIELLCTPDPPGSMRRSPGTHHGRESELGKGYGGERESTPARLVASLLAGYRGSSGWGGVWERHIPSPREWDLGKRLYPSPDYFWTLLSQMAFCCILGGVWTCWNTFISLCIVLSNYMITFIKFYECRLAFILARFSKNSPTFLHCLLAFLFFSLSLLWSSSYYE